MLYIVIGGLQAADATVTVERLRGVRPTFASGIGYLDCDACAGRLVVVGDLKAGELDVGRRFFVSLASHGAPSAEYSVDLLSSHSRTDGRD